MDLVDIDKVLDDFEFNEEKLEIEKIEQQKKGKINYFFLNNYCL